MEMQKQSKNTIKSTIAVLALTILGQGIFGLGVYLPFLLILSNWDGVYWLAFGVGILISVLRGLSIGLPSIYLIVLVGILSLVMSNRKEMGMVLIVISVVANILFNILFGLPRSIWEVVMTVIFGMLALAWFEKSDSIRINY